ASAAAYAAADPVAVQVAHAPTAPGFDACRYELNHLVELSPSQVPVRPRPGDQRKQLIFGDPLLAPGRRLCNHLLGEDVQRPLGRMQRVQASPLDRPEQGSALDQLIPGRRVHDPPGYAGAVVICPTNTLE